VLFGSSLRLGSRKCGRSLEKNLYYLKKLEILLSKFKNFWKNTEVL
jgi:hypothetical protein